MARPGGLAGLWPELRITNEESIHERHELSRKDKGHEESISDYESE
jgi:hypothetical protein